MKRLWAWALCLVLLIALPVAGQLATTAAAVPQAYRDLILGFQFLPPPGWTLKEVEGELGQVSLSDPENRALLLLTVAPAPGAQDNGKPASPSQLAQLAKTFEARLASGQLRRVYAKISLIGAIPGRIGRFEAAELLFQGLPKQANAAEGRIFVATGSDLGRSVTLIVVAPANRFANLRPALDRVLQSFALM